MLLLLLLGACGEGEQSGGQVCKHLLRGNLLLLLLLSSSCVATTECGGGSQLCTCPVFCSCCRRLQLV